MACPAMVGAVANGAEGEGTVGERVVLSLPDLPSGCSLGSDLCCSGLVSGGCLPRSSLGSARLLRGSGFRARILWLGLRPPTCRPRQNVASQAQRRLAIFAVSGRNPKPCDESMQTRRKSPRFASKLRASHIRPTRIVLRSYKRPADACKSLQTKS